MGTTPSSFINWQNEINELPLVREQFSSHLRNDPLHVRLQRLPTLVGSIADSTESPLNDTDGHIFDSIYIPYTTKLFIGINIREIRNCRKW